MRSTLALIIPALIIIALQPISRTCNAVELCGGIYALICIIIITVLMIYNWHRISIFALAALLSIYAQWGIVQFILQHDIGFYLIGESRINAATTGVAKFSIGSEKIMRPYGPFLHANVFGGAMLCAIVMSLLYLPSSWRKHLIPLFVFALGVSFSRSAYIGLLGIPFLVSRIRSKQVFIGISIVTLILFPLIMFRALDPQSTAASERVRGYTWALGIIREQSIYTGVGIGKYVTHLKKYLADSHIAYQPWELAPVHSVPLLAGAELGIISTTGIGVALLLGLQLRRMKIILPLIPALLLDHYFATDIVAFTLLCMLLVVSLTYPLPLHGNQ